MRALCGSIVAALVTLSAMAIAQSRPQRLGVVNGEVLTEEQVTKAAARDLENLELKRLQAEATNKRERHEILEKTLNGMIEDKLLAAEAAKRQITREALIQAETEKNVTVPTAAEVEAFYEQNKSRINASREEVLPQIGPYLMEQRRNDARSAFIAGLKKQYNVTSYLEPLRFDFTIAGQPSRGPAGAAVTIVEFSDFECPFCGGLFPTMKEVEKNYGDRIRLVYRQFPLTSIHPRAQKAAEASLCANEQQKFWEFHDSLFLNQQDLTIDALKRRASEMKLDTGVFDSCLDSGKHAEAVSKDIAEGSRAGVSGTPALFINGRLLSGNQPYASITAVIEDELQRKSATK